VEAGHWYLFWVNKDISPQMMLSAVILPTGLTKDIRNTEN
jgi:hypothetical protein